MTRFPSGSSSTTPAAPRSRRASSSPTSTSSSAPAGGSASATSCCGGARTPSPPSPPATGPISGPRTWPRRTPKSARGRCRLAGLSLRGVAIRGLHSWEYVQAGFAAAVGACVGALALVGRDVRWEELPSGGALRHLRAVGAGTLLALPLLLVFGGLFASADAVFGNVLAGAFDIDFGAVASHTFLIAC